MSFTKYPSIIFCVDIADDGSQDRAIAETLVAAGQILDRHLTPEQHAILGRQERDHSTGIHLALPIAIQIRDRNLLSEMVSRADPGPYPGTRGLNFMMSAEDGAAARQGVNYRSSSDPAPGAEIPSVDIAARTYKAAKRDYDSAVKPTSESPRAKWEAYWLIVNSMVKAKRMLELAAEQAPDEALPN
jgi:hypothetical protein